MTPNPRLVVIFPDGSTVPRAAARPPLRAEEPVRKKIYRECRRKKAYNSHAVAARAANRALKYRGHRLRIYACDFCNKFHLTKTGAG